MQLRGFVHALHPVRLQQQHCQILAALACTLFLKCAQQTCGRVFCVLCEHAESSTTILYYPWPGVWWHACLMQNMHSCVPVCMHTHAQVAAPLCSSIHYYCNYYCARLWQL